MSLSIFLCCRAPLVSDQLQLEMQNVLHDVSVHTNIEAISLDEVKSYDVVVLSPEERDLKRITSLARKIRESIQYRHIPIIVYVSPGQDEMIPALTKMGPNEIFAFTPLSNLRDFCLKLGIIHRRCQILQKMQSQLELFDVSGYTNIALPRNERYEMMLSDQAKAILDAAIHDGIPVHHNDSLQQIENTITDDLPKMAIIDLAVGRDALKLASKVNSLYPEIPVLLLIPSGYSHWVESCSDLGLGNVMIYPDHVALLENKLIQLKCWCRHYQFYQEQFDLQLNRSIVDDLTGLFNRRYLDQMLNRCIKNENSFALLLVDIDKFKVVNDTYGHLVGDEVLRILSGRMLGQFRPHDTVGRWGGEEFVVILSNVDAETAINLADRLRQTFDGDVLHVDHEDGSVVDLSITISIGISTFQSGDTLGSVTNRADSCLYLAKENGRNQVQYQQSFA